jgi:hypothetical protein
MLFVLAGRSLRGRTIPYVSLAAAGLVASFVVFPVIEGKRAKERFSLDSVADGIRMASDARSGTNSGTILDSLRFATANVSERMHGMESLATILYRVPEIVPHEGLDSFASRLLWSFAPRAFFPEKPIVARGSFFNSKLVQMNTESIETAPIAVFQIGEAYYIAGSSFVIVIAAWIGWYSRIISKLQAWFPYEGFFPYFCLLLWTLSAVERDIILVWTSLPRSLLVFTLLYGLCSTLLGKSNRHTGRFKIDSQNSAAPGQLHSATVGSN